jgi:hypothetical protein
LTADYRYDLPTAGIADFDEVAFEDPRMARVDPRCGPTRDSNEFHVSSIEIFPVIRYYPFSVIPVTT